MSRVSALLTRLWYMQEVYSVPRPNTGSAGLETLGQGLGRVELEARG